MAEYNPSKIIKDGNTYNFRDNTKIPLSGTNALAGSIVPSTDNSYDFGSSTYKLRYVYCDTAYVTNLNINGTAAGDILTHNASEFVDVTSNQTVAGNKTFTGATSFTASPGIVRNSDPFCQFTTSNYDKGTSPANSMYAGVRFYCNPNSAVSNKITGGFEMQYDTSGYNIAVINCRNYNQNNVQLNYSVGLYVPNDSTRPIQFVPAVNNTINLGSSSLQWNNTYTRNILIDNDINIASSLINKTGTSGVISIRGGLNTQDGASIGLYGKDYNGGIAGNIYMTAYGNSDYTNFRIYPNGTMTVYNNSAATTKNVAMQEDVIPRSGGAVMTGIGLGRNVNNDQLRYSGGTGWNMGATLTLYGKDEATYGGRALIHPSDGTESKNMWFKSDGTWTWDGTACQITSDQRLKQQISNIDDKLLDAWEDVDLVQFKYNDAVDEKGDKARLHTGYVVQQIDNACKEHGVDVSQYGLYCHEVYPEETEEVEVEQADGTKTKETKVIREASEHYSLRYTEALIVECKYLRRCIQRLTARIEELEKENNNK